MTRLLSVSLVALALSQNGLSVASASPISYDFSGTFATPVDGATTFSGTFSYDSNVPLNSAAQQVPPIAYYSDAPGDAGHLITMSFAFGNTKSSDLGTVTNDELVVWHSATTDELNLDVTYTKPNGQYMGMTIGLLNDNTISPGPFTSLAPPQTLPLSGFNQGTQFIFNSFSNSSSNNGPVVGTITSLHPSGAANIPEPTTLSIFMVAGLAFFRWGRSGRPSSQRG